MTDIRKTSEDELLTCTCEDCGVMEDSPEDYHYTNDDGDIICDDCWNNYCDCVSCGGTYLTDDLLYSDNDSEYYCNDCYSDTFISCNHCGDEIYHDDECYNENTDESLCYSCYENGDSDSPEWSVHSSSYVNDNSDFVNPRTDQYESVGDTFEHIKSRRYVGVEIETNTRYEPNDYYDIKHRIKRRIASTRDIDDTIIRDRVVSDGSVTNGDHPHGFEVVMDPRRGDILYQDVKSVCDHLKEEEDAYVSVKCGLHIHIDIRDYDWYHFQVLALMTKMIEPHVYTWVPESRLKSNWCRPVSQNVQDFKYVSNRDEFIDFWYDHSSYNNDKYNDKRYHGLNFHSHFQANQGIEIRYHGGTLNPDKIKHWIIFWTNVVDKCKEIGDKEIADGNLSDENFQNTSLMQSIENSFDFTSSHIFNKLRQKYSSEAKFTDIKEYYKDSEFLRDYLKLDKLDKPYLIPSMLDHIRNRKNGAVMSIENIFDVFEIPKDTQDFFDSRSNELSHKESIIRECFKNKSCIVEFDASTNKFIYIDNLGAYLPTIADEVIKNVFSQVGFNSLRNYRTESNEHLYDYVL